MMRSVFLWASQNRWLRERLPRYRFARKSVARFMPGEEFADALAAAQTLAKQGINAVFTKLGENIGDKKEAAEVREHYLGVLGNIERTGLNAEISVKLTQLGLDLSKETCFENLRALVERAGENNIVWIDMESSPYLDRTLELYRRAREAYANVGVCLQAYLYRTAKDLAALRPLGPAVRLVKGAYQEPASVAFSRKRDVDENFFALSKEHARRRVDPAHRGARAGRGAEQTGFRVPDALWHPAPRAVAAGPTRLALQGALRLRQLLVPLVHAPARRAPRERLVRTAQPVFLR